MLSAIFKKEQAAEAAPESASTGLWQLAMRRLKRDRIAMFSLYVVLFYLLLLVLSMSGLIAKDWNKEVAVSYAPPSFINAAPVPVASDTEQSAESVPLPVNPVDPLKDVIAELNAEIAAEQGAGAGIDYYGVVDPRVQLK